MSIPEYHGQEIRPDRPPRDVPPMPQTESGRPPEYMHGHPIAGLDAGLLQRLGAAGRPDPNRTYPHVQLIGTYNIGCIDTQKLDYYGITPKEAVNIAWQAFGVCPHVIAYFDENEQLVASD